MLSGFLFTVLPKSFPEKKKKSTQNRQFPLIRDIYTISILFILSGGIMNYVKKMCILRQVKQGFSGDGKALSGLIKIEQYGKNLAVEVSIINFAPLVSGEYYCLLSDGKGKTEMLSLRGKSFFNLLSDLDISTGFCGIVCYVKNEIVPIAYGINGNGTYDWRRILNATLPPVFPRESVAFSEPEKEPLFSEKPQNEPPRVEMNEKTPPIEPPVIEEKTNYDDETVASENYYGKEEDEQENAEQVIQNAHPQSPTESQGTQAGSDAKANGDSQSVLHPFKTEADGYYASVKSEIDDLFRTYPRDKTLNGAFSCSEWVRVKGTAKQPEYLVGVLYLDDKAAYICYALAAENPDAPPDEIKNVCSFVPVNALENAAGFFVLFQSAASGECMKPEKIRSL